MNTAPLARAFRMGSAALAFTWAMPMAAQAQDTSDIVVESEMDLPSDGEWKHSFDAYEGEAGKLNGPMQTALRFARAMEEAGVASSQVKVAIVVHGPAVFDVASDARYKAKYDTQFVEYSGNPNKSVVEKLLARGAENWVCGVAATYHGVGNADLIEGVKMAPSGTVAHAELHRRGFGLTPY